AHLLEQHSAPSTAEETVEVVIQLRKGNRSALVGFLNANGIRFSKEFKNLDAATIDLPVRLLSELANFEEVHFVSGNDEVQSLGHASSTTGADDIRSVMPNGDVLDGSGLGIAIVDSGIYSAHRSFNGRVVFSKDFTSENRTDDPFGHGTHVAGAAAGNSAVQDGSYTGIAPNANLINLRVLDSQGRGKVSDVLSALDWLYSNHRAYNIRVVVMSLGGAAVSSYRNDPLCLAVRRLVDAGVVVVAAAGNDGKDQFGRKQYGGIHSPANEPSAITVGATNSFGTDARNDDVVTSYSSRGPTRSYWTDNRGVKHYDNLIKPDLVAPGNKLVFAASPNSLLGAENPTLEAGTGKTKQQMMYMSGTSVSAPLV
ncbi:MAG TPA: S8 family serine peptidase, partial [Candidatus Saccharimonadales bacterium]|nr:S8 family serine peptidase [Candidatus Saccharimonadales bacterium]